MSNSRQGSQKILCCPQVNIYSTSRLSPLTMIFQPTSTETWGKLPPNTIPLTIRGDSRVRIFAKNMDDEARSEMSVTTFFPFPFRNHKLVKLRQTSWMSSRWVVVAPSPICRFSMSAPSLLPQRLTVAQISYSASFRRRSLRGYWVTLQQRRLRSDVEGGAAGTWRILLRDQPT